MANRDHLPLLKKKPLVLAANCRPPSRSKGLAPSLTVDLTIESARDNKERKGKERASSMDRSVSFTTLMKEMMLKLQIDAQAQAAAEKPPEVLSIQAVSMPRRVRRRSKMVLSAMHSSRTSWLQTRHFDPISSFRPLQVPKPSQLTQTQGSLS